MNIYPPNPFQRAPQTGDDAVFRILRERLARSVTSSAVLADLLQKLNRMQEAHARPEEFQQRFGEFLSRAEDDISAIRPCFPGLVTFLPLHQPCPLPRRCSCGT